MRAAKHAGQESTGAQTRWPRVNRSTNALATQYEILVLHIIVGLWEQERLKRRQVNDFVNLYDPPLRRGRTRPEKTMGKRQVKWCKHTAVNSLRTTRMYERQILKIRIAEAQHAGSDWRCQHREKNQSPLSVSSLSLISLFSSLSMMHTHTYSAPRPSQEEQERERSVHRTAAQDSHTEMADKEDEFYLFWFKRFLTILGLESIYCKGFNGRGIQIPIK